jgi:hypothetical protein
MSSSRRGNRTTGFLNVFFSFTSLNFPGLLAATNTARIVSALGHRVSLSDPILHTSPEFRRRRNNLCGAAVDIDAALARHTEARNSAASSDSACIVLTMERQRAQGAFPQFLAACLKHLPWASLE